MEEQQHYEEEHTCVDTLVSTRPAKLVQTRNLSGNGWQTYNSSVAEGEGEVVDGYLENAADYSHF